MQGIFAATKFVFLAAAALLASAAVVPNEAGATVLISINETGSSVVATTSGTLDLAGLNSIGIGSTGAAFIQPVFGAFSSAAGSANFYSGLSYLAGYGSGGFTIASSFSGDVVYFNVDGDGYIGVPLGYVSNTALSATTTFTSATLASLGLATGTYVFNTPADSIIVRIGNVAAVPEPATWAMMLVGFAAIGFSMRRRRVSYRLTQVA